jgi:hypothetical protein
VKSSYTLCHAVRQLYSPITASIVLTFHKVLLENEDYFGAWRAP